MTLNLPKNIIPYILTKEMGISIARRQLPILGHVVVLREKNFLAKRGSEPVGWKKSGILMGARRQD